jgi:transmembrane 9 superfamily protein 2/4
MLLAVGRMAALAMVLPCVQGFYLPGVAPREFQEGELVPLKVNKLTSTKTQLPYEFYSLPFCQPTNTDTVAENLGEVLRGDKIMHSDYELKMGVEESCKVLCRKQLTAAEAKLFSSRIEEDYRVTDMIVDNLPAATRVVEPATPTSPSRVITIYERGFPLGFKGSAEIPGTSAGVNYLYNHHRMVFKYHMEPSFEGSRIVGFEVEPFSVKHAYTPPYAVGTPLSTCSKAKPVTHDRPPQQVSKEDEVIFSYDVRW